MFREPDKQGQLWEEPYFLSWAVVCSRVHKSLVPVARVLPFTVAISSVSSQSLV